MHLLPPDARWLWLFLLLPSLSLIFYSGLFTLFRFLFKFVADSDDLQPERTERHIKHDLSIACVLYLSCVVLYFYPCLTRLSTCLIGPPEDNMSCLWNMWWAQRAVSGSNASLYFSDHVFYPEGMCLLFQNFSFYTLLPSLLLTKVFTPALAYNLLILHSFVLAGIGAFLLIKYLTNDSLFAVIGGYIFAFNPSHFAHALHHIDIAQIQFIPFFILYFLKASQSRSKKDLSLACVFLFLNAACHWYYLIFNLYVMIIVYAYRVIAKKQCVDRHLLLNSAAIGGVTLLLFSPWIARMMQVGMQYPGVKAGGHDTFVADLVAFIVPDPYHWLANSRLVRGVNWRLSGNSWEQTAYLGVVNILVLLVAIRGIIKKTARYVLGLITGMILSMGMYVHIMGRSVPIVLPFAVTVFLPFLSIVRSPSRFVVYAYLCLAILVAIALRHFMDAYKPSIKRNCVMGMVVVLIMVDYGSVCVSMTEVSVPACYSAITTEGKPFGIMDLPPSFPKGRGMMYQTFHGFPIVEGYVARKVGQTLLDRLELQDLDRQKKQLTDNRVKFIVIHKKWALTPPLFDIARYEAEYETIFADNENLVMRVY